MATKQRERALQAIEEGLTNIDRGEADDSRYIAGMGFGQLLVAYYYLLPPGLGRQLLGDPVEWAAWLRNGLRDVRDGVAAALAGDLRKLGGL